MAQNTVKARFIIQHKTASAFASDKTVYYEGELLIEEDTLKMKVGDGTNTFANLDYINLNPTEVQSLINAAKHTHSNKSVLDATTASFTTALLNKLNGIAANANNYVHPSTAGNKHIPSGGSSGQILRWSSDGTAVWGTDNNTTYSNMSGASSSSAGKAGLVPAPSAGASNRYLRSDGTWQVPPDTNTTYSNMKGATTEAAGSSGLVPAPSTGSANRYLRSDGTWAVPPDTNTTYSTGNATTAGITKLYTATGSGTDGTMTQKAITDALNGKASSSHTHNYAGSGSAGGSANSAVRLDSSAGSATQPVYFSGGKPVACTYTLGKSVPSNAVFTDTNTWIALKGSTSNAAGTAGYAPAPSAGASNRYLRCDGTWSVPPDNNTTYSNMSGASSSAAGKAGLVPAPSAGASNRYLRSDGTWQVPPDTNTTYSTGNATTAGITKLYTATGSGTDGTMTQKAITDVLNGKANLSHTHNYAGASNPGGAAYTAERLTTGTAGSSTTPVYFSNGSPVACNKSFDELKNEFILACYPVGSIYMSTSSTNPGSLFGGTWVAWGSGRVPVGVNTNDTNFNTVEKTGGASTVTLSVYNMPSHYHTVNSHNHIIPKLSGTAASNGAHTHNITFKYNSDAQQNGRAARITSGGSKTTALNSDVSDIKSAGAHTHSISTNAGTTGNSSPNTNSRGSGSAHNNLQPYITCYMWKRTA